MSRVTSHYRTFFRATVIIGISVILSRVLGLFREQYSLYLFGVGWELDAYVSAYKIPTVLRNLLGDGAFSVVFISIFSVLWPRNKRAAQKFFNQTMTYLFFASLFISILCFIFTPTYMSLIHRSQENFALMVHLSRIMIAFINFISLAGILMGVLNAQDKYFIPAIAPAISNIVNILVIYWGHKALGIDILAIGYLLSAVVLFLVQVPAVWRIGLRFHFDFSFTPRLKFFLRSFFPVAFGMAFFQINQLLTNSYSSQIEGGNTVIDRASLIIQMAIAVLSAGISTALLPSIAKERDHLKKDQIYKQGLKITFLIIFPMVILFYIFGTQISSYVYHDLILLFVGNLGKINDLAVKEIGNMITLFAPAILIYSLVTMVTRAFQGMRLYIYPLMGSIVSTLLNIIFMRAFFPIYGIKTLPLSLIVGSLVNFILLVYLLSFRTKNKVGWSSGVLFVIQSFLSALFMILFSEQLYSVFIKHMSNLIALPLSFMFGLLGYFGILLLLKEEITRRLWGKILRKT